MQKVPDSIKDPLSLRADYANPHLYGAAGMVAGMLSLALGFFFLAGGGFLAAAIWVGLGALLAGAGYWMFTRAD